MRAIGSVARSRVQGYALTHGRGPLFTMMLGGLILAWTFGIIAATGELCSGDGMLAANEPVATEQRPAVRAARCEPTQDRVPGELLRCVIDRGTTQHDI